MTTWNEYKKSITSISETEKKSIEQKARMVSAIARRRRMLGWTQAEVAARAGLTQSAIARLENSAQIPRFDTLQKVASALGLRIELVLEDDEQAAAAEELRGIQVGTMNTVSNTDSSVATHLQVRSEKNAAGITYRN